MPDMRRLIAHEIALAARVRIPYLLLLVMGGWLLSLAPALATPEIRWEVANRFPFFRDEGQFRTIADIYGQLPLADRQNNPVMALEREMEKRANARQLGAAFGDSASVWRYGWASALVRSTCFSATNRGHWSCRLANGESYIGARKADILVSLDNAPANQSCQWLLNDVPATTEPCSNKLVRIAGAPVGENFMISVKTGDAVLAQAVGQTIRPVTVLGMGDSFASGEGNPDRPAIMGSDFSTFQNSSPLPGQTGWGLRKFRQYPLRQGHSSTQLGQPALWINQQCHRSLYSHQLRAALTIALEAPHVSVAYLGYACTGAEVEEGLLGYWSARDDISANYRDDSPQIMRALRDLCASKQGYNRFTTPRKSFSWDADIQRCARFIVPRVDAVLVSIGGNDIGFASVIANETLHPNGEFLLPVIYGIWRKSAAPISFDAAIANEANLADRYKTLARALDTLLGVKPAQVIQTGYPQMLKTDSGTCPLGTAGMDVHAIFEITKPTTGPTSVNFVTGLNAKIRSIVPWQVVDGFAGTFSGHALCTGGMDDGTNGADNLKFPLGILLGHRWTEFDPSGWQPYRTRKRWFVTPNDAFLTANSMRLKSGSGGDPNPQGRAQPLLAATMSGSFHPNALGQAAIADGVVKTLRFKLQLPIPAGVPAESVVKN